MGRASGQKTAVSILVIEEAVISTLSGLYDVLNGLAQVLCVAWEPTGSTSTRSMSLIPTPRSRRR